MASRSRVQKDAASILYQDFRLILTFDYAARTVVPLRTKTLLVLTELLCQIDGLDETIERFNKQIEEYCHPFEEGVVLLDTIPGVGREVAEIIVSEIGIDMSRFPSADALASWAGVAPGNNESAGKRRSGKTTKGNQALSVALNQAAHGASHTKDTY